MFIHISNILEHRKERTDIHHYVAWVHSTFRLHENQVHTNVEKHEYETNKGKYVT